MHLVRSLQADGLPTSKAFLLQFTELIHCMMYQYSGFPDLYDHILEAIKVNEPWNEVVQSEFSSMRITIIDSTFFLCLFMLSLKKKVYCAIHLPVMLRLN